MNRQSVLEVNKSNFLYNIEQIKKYINNEAEIMPVIKANGYGTYINKCLDLIENFKIVAVACVSEAIELRDIGYKGDIFVLNQPYIEDIPNILKYDVTVGVADINFIRELGNNGNKFRIHLELETGMGRTGIYSSDLDNIIELVLGYDNVLLNGVYTHFSSADSDYEYTLKQFEIFEEGVSLLKSKIDTLDYVHASASNGIVNFPIGLCNYVRAGIIMYGYASAHDTLDKIDLKPILRLKSKISFIKMVPEDYSISYGRTFISNKEMKIATVGIGYADGIRRELSNKGEVVVNGIKCSIVGRVCMDSFMIDVSELSDVKVGDLVYIWDNEVVTLEDIASCSGTINYEIMSTISSRVPRIFID